MVQNRSPFANRFLSALPASEYQRLEPHLFDCSLTMGEVVYEVSEKIETVYFPNTALISLVNTLKNGNTTEIGIVGGTGTIGLPAILSNGYSPNRAIVQVSGKATKISAHIVKQEFNRGGELHRLLLNYTQTRLNELAQLSACNVQHTIEERLARWLLTVQDLTQSDELPLTQEFISNMLGVRRSGVTLSAGILQQSNLIRYKRGRINILDREGLRATACECYELFYHNHCRQSNSDGRANRT